MYRKIYEIAVYTETGILRMMRFAANKKTAEKIAKPYGSDAIIKLTDKDEKCWIDPKQVERI